MARLVTRGSIRRAAERLPFILLTAIPALSLVSGDCGSPSNPETSARSDRIVVDLAGAEPRQVVVAVHLTSAASVPTSVLVFVEGLQVTPGPDGAAVFQASCEDSMVRSVDLAWPPFFEPRIGVGRVSSPSTFDCVFDITPTEPLSEPIEVEWHVSALVEWGYEDRHIDVEVTLEVSED